MRSLPSPLHPLFCLLDVLAISLAYIFFLPTTFPPWQATSEGRDLQMLSPSTSHRHARRLLPFPPPRACHDSRQLIIIWKAPLASRPTDNPSKRVPEIAASRRSWRRIGVQQTCSTCNQAGNLSWAQVGAVTPVLHCPKIRSLYSSLVPFPLHDFPFDPLPHALGCFSIGSNCRRHDAVCSPFVRRPEAMHKREPN